MQNANAYRALGIGPNANELLAISDFDRMSKRERWELIDCIDERIDRYQYWQQRTPSGTAEHELIVDKLKALRLKRFSVWQSFYPKFNDRIRIGVQ